MDLTSLRPVPVEFTEQPWGCKVDQEAPRTVLTKMVYDWIKENGLQTEEDRRVISTSGEAGKVLRKLFHLKLDEKLEFKNFQTYMARLYNRDNLPDYESEDEEVEEVVNTKESQRQRQG